MKNLKYARSIIFFLLVATWCSIISFSIIDIVGYLQKVKYSDLEVLMKISTYIMVLIYCIINSYFIYNLCNTKEITPKIRYTKIFAFIYALLMLAVGITMIVIKKTYYYDITIQDYIFPTIGLLHALLCFK